MKAKKLSFTGANPALITDLGPVRTLAESGEGRAQRELHKIAHKMAQVTLEGRVLLMSVHDTEMLPGFREDLEFQSHRKPCLGSTKHAAVLSRRKTKMKTKWNELTE